MAKKEIIDIEDTSELENKLANHINKETKVSDQEIVEKPKRVEVSNAVRERMEAMSRFNLRPATIGVKAELETDDDLHLTIIAKKLGKDKQRLVAEYILQGLEKDMKKIGIFEHKK